MRAARGPTRADLDAARDRAVDDVLPRDGTPLRVLFCGINPSLYAAATGYHFARPGNRFWPALYRSGFTPRPLAPYEQHLLAAYGLGITNLVARATARADELDRAELRTGGLRLAGLVRRYRPRYLAIAGVTAYRTAFGRPRAAIGPQPGGSGEAAEPGAPDGSGPFGAAGLWVLPNPSGLNASWSLDRIAAEFGRLRAAVDGVQDRERPRHDALARDEPAPG